MNYLAQIVAILAPAAVVIFGICRALTRIYRPDPPRTIGSVLARSHFLQPPTPLERFPGSTLGIAVAAAAYIDEADSLAAARDRIELLEMTDRVRRATMKEQAERAARNLDESLRKMAAAQEEASQEARRKKSRWSLN